MRKQTAHTKPADRFLLECCEHDPNAFTLSSDLLAANRVWAKRLYQPILNSKGLAETLRAAPYDAVTHKRNGRMGWQGIRLKNDAKPAFWDQTGQRQPASEPVLKESKAQRFYVCATKSHLIELKEAAAYAGITMSSWILLAALREARALIADKTAMAAGKEQRIALS